LEVAEPLTQNEMKQSSIEWLISFIEPSLTPEQKHFFSTVIERAKAMHKDEIENAYWDGGQWIPTVGSQCEEYYKETFNTKEK
jgi:hypothetical protein